MRKLVAALACRAKSSRLYAKPLQNLITGTTILDQILNTIEQLPMIDTAVLGIAEGIENMPFIEIAKRRNIPYILGDEIDILSRLIACGRIASATDIFRISTESPFLYYQPLEQAWQNHQRKGNDVTTTDALPYGTHFEIYTLKSLEDSHRLCTKEQRIEACSLYIRANRDQFQIEVIEPPAKCKRTDIRLTVDYPEDLIICRAVYKHFQQYAPLISLEQIIEFLDQKPELLGLTKSFHVGKPYYWKEV